MTEASVQLCSQKTWPVVKAKLLPHPPGLLRGLGSFSVIIVHVENKLGESVASGAESLKNSGKEVQSLKSFSLWEVRSR